MPQEQEEYIFQLEAKIEEMEKDINEKYCQFGKCLLELAEQENRRIGALVDRLIVLKKKLIEVKQEFRCPACLTVIQQDSRFCSQCGARLGPHDNKEESL